MRFGAKRRVTLVAAVALCALPLGCGGDDETPVDDSSGIFETVELLASGGLLAGGGGETITAIRALAVNDNRVVAVEADLDTGGTALLLVEDGVDGGAPTVTVVIKTGQNLPNGAGVFDHVVPEDPTAYQNENVYVDASDRVVFMANDGSATPVTLGVFRAGTDGVVEKLAVVSDAAGGDIIVSFEPRLACSPSGGTAFVADLASGPTRGVFYCTGPGAITKVALEGEEFPGAPGTYFNDAFAHVFVNDDGHVGFKVGSQGTLYQFAWRWRGGSDLMCLAWPNDLPMPGLPGATVISPTIEGVHADGRVVVSSASSSPFLRLCLHRYSDPGTAGVVVIPGAPAPSGDTFFGLAAGDLRAVPSGWVSCQASEEASGETIIFRNAGSVTEQVVRHGAPVPGGGATITSTPRHRLGNSGRVVYAAVTDTVPMLCRMNAAGESAVVAAVGQSVPGPSTDLITAIDQDHFFVNGTGGIVYTVTTNTGATLVLTGE